MEQGKICDSCNSLNDAEVSFCSKCGLRLLSDVDSESIMNEDSSSYTASTSEDMFLPTDDKQDVQPATPDNTVDYYDDITTTELVYDPAKGKKGLAVATQADDKQNRLAIRSYDPLKEIGYFKSPGEIIVKKTEHRGLGRKAASFLVAGPIGYVAFGRDKTRKSKAEGTLVITDKALYCAGNVYPYDKVVAITKQRKSILLLLEKDMSNERISVALEMKTKDKDGLFRALEAARMKNIQF